MEEFIDDFFYEKLHMPSSYDMQFGGDLPRDQAISKEVLPAQNDNEYRRYYEEQMQAMRAQQSEADRQRRIEDLGFDPDDGNTIDVEIGDDGVARQASDTREVGQAQTTAVAMPKPIWYAVDFHVASGGYLGYSGGRGGNVGGSARRGSIGGRRSGSGRYLREDRHTDPLSDIARAYAWAKTEGFDRGLEAIATADPQLRDSPGFLAYIFKYGNRYVKYITETKRSGGFVVEWEGPAGQFPWDNIYGLKEVTVMTKAELDASGAGSLTENDLDDMMKEAKLSQSDLDDIADLTGAHVPSSWGNTQYGYDFVTHDYNVKKDANRSDQATGIGDLNHARDLDNDDEGELGEADDVEEDEYRRPKNRPHNLHRVDEDDEDESEELNESMVRFCDRLIRG